MVTLATVVNTTVRSAFEYQGQKCSACSRMYVPDTLWPQVWYPVFGVCDIHDGTFGVVLNLHRTLGNVYLHSMVTLSGVRNLTSIALNYLKAYHLVSG